MQIDTRSSYRKKWDAIGIGASLLCAIHCVLLPFFFSTLSFWGIELLKNKMMEAVMIITSLLVGSWALFTGCRQQHHRRWPILLFALGMMLLLSSLWISSEGKEMVCKALAAACVTTAHVFNWKYSKACQSRPDHR